MTRIKPDMSRAKKLTDEERAERERKLFSLSDDRNIEDADKVKKVEVKDPDFPWKKSTPKKYMPANKDKGTGEVGLKTNIRLPLWHVDVLDWFASNESRTIKQGTRHAVMMEALSLGLNQMIAYETEISKLRDDVGDAWDDS